MEFVFFLFGGRQLMAGWLRSLFEGFIESKIEQNLGLGIFGWFLKCCNFVERELYYNLMFLLKVE